MDIEASDPRDVPQPSPGSPDLDIADSETLIPLRPLAPISIRPVEVVSRDRGVCDVVQSFYDSGDTYTAPLWAQVGTFPPSDPSARRHLYRLVLGCSVPALFVPYDISPQPPGADITRAMYLPAGLHQLEGVTGGYLSVTASGVISATLLRTMFTDPA